jgi:hypothetical protein
VLLAAEPRHFDAAQIPTDGRGSEVLSLRQALIGSYLWFGRILLAASGALLGWAADRAAGRRRTSASTDP